jgi:hypothetical protein
MKKFIFSILFILIFHIGCASLKPERNVVNNQFVSTYPKIKIQIIPELAYIEGISQSGYAEGLEIQLTHSEDSYAFVEAEKATSEVKRAVIIEIKTTGGYYMGDFYRNMEKTALEFGKLEIGGKEYRYFTTIGTPTDKGYLTRHIYEKGYTMSCGLFKFYGRLIGANNVLTQIIYYENIKNSGLSCHSWKYKQSLTDSHLQYLEGYNQRFKSSLEILEQ